MRNHHYCQYANVLYFGNIFTYIQCMDKTMIEIIKKLMSVYDDNSYGLAEKCGISQPTIHRILKGKHADPRISTLSSIAKAYGVTVSQIIGDVPLNLDKQNKPTKTFFTSIQERERLFELANEMPVESIPQAIKLLDIAKDLPTNKDKTDQEE